MRATPVGRRKALQQPRNLAFEPFKEDFEWIVNKMKSERFRLMHEPSKQSDDDEKKSSLLLPDVAIDMESVAPSNNVVVMGGGNFSVLQHGLVSELLERRSQQETYWEAIRLLVPSSRKGWVLLMLLFAAVLVLGSFSQFQPVGEERKGIVLLRETFWWGALAAFKGRLVTGKKNCETTAVGPLGTIVDSIGVQCKAEEVNTETGCCFGGFAPVPASASRHCRGCSESGCCSSFLDCVECCLTSDHQTVLRYQMFALSNRGFPGVDISDFNRFELCQALCRTSSKSIDIHGKFLNEQLRHCYVISDSRATV